MGLITESSHPLAAPDSSKQSPTDQESAMETSSRRRFKEGTTLIVVGLVVCIVPYFISIGLTVYFVGVFHVLKSNQTMKNKAMVLAVSFAILVGYYAWVISWPGPW
jgi:hypothetical protein